MAAKRNRINSAECRAKIRASYLINRLQAHVRGRIKLTLSQVRAAELLLRKVVPDLVQTQINADVTHKYVVEVPPLLTKDEWSKKYRTPQPTLELKAGPPLLPVPAKNGQDIH